ncbi:MAG: WzyE family oligosaccharide polymerase [Candidatus Malihini olakiniferum]
MFYFAYAAGIDGGDGLRVVYPIGAIVVGLIVKWFDALYERLLMGWIMWPGNHVDDDCRHLCGLWSTISILYEWPPQPESLQRGGAAFVSHVVFFALMFGLFLLVAKLLYWLFESAGLIRQRWAHSPAEPAILTPQT